MDIKKELLKEHSKWQAIKIANYVGDDPARFKELMELFLRPECRVSQRAAWSVNFCSQQHPELIKSHLAAMIKNLDREDLHDAVKRNTVRILQFIDIPEKLQGDLADICFRYLLSADEPAAIKAFSMSVLFNICKDHPELKNELKMIIEDQMPYAPASFIARGRKILTALK
jgi:hypothetical protein